MSNYGKWQLDRELATSQFLFHFMTLSSFYAVAAEPLSVWREGSLRLLCDFLILCVYTERILNFRIYH